MYGGAERAKWAYINTGDSHWGMVYGILKNREAQGHSYASPVPATPPPAREPRKDAQAPVEAPKTERPIVKVPMARRKSQKAPNPDQPIVKAPVERRKAPRTPEKVQEVRRLTERERRAKRVSEAIKAHRLLIGVNPT
jgi:hypothetical protein